MNFELQFLDHEDDLMVKAPYDKLKTALRIAETDQIANAYNITGMGQRMSARRVYGQDLEWVGRTIDTV
jgi:hypothetical protein